MFIVYSSGEIQGRIQRKGQLNRQKTARKSFKLIQQNPYIMGNNTLDNLHYLFRTSFRMQIWKNNLETLSSTLSVLIQLNIEVHILNQFYLVLQWFPVRFLHYLRMKFLVFIGILPKYVSSGFTLIRFFINPHLIWRNGS